MIRRVTAPAGISAAFLVLAGCGGGDSDGGRTRDNDSLEPAEEVSESSAADAAQVLDLGEFGELEAMDGTVRLTAKAMKVGGDDGGRWLVVALRLENSGDEALGGPNIAIVCTDGAEEGGWQADSTLDMGAEIPAGSFSEGTLNLLLPGDSRTGEAVPECLAPAYVQATPTVYMGDVPPSIQYQIPAEVLTELNGR